MFRFIPNQYIHSLLLFYVIWDWNFSIFDPIRKIFGKRSVSARIKYSSNVCSSCHESFGSGRKRKLVDVCGHQRCYSCIVSTDKCPICLTDGVTSTRKRMGFLDKIFNKTKVGDKKRRLAIDFIENSSHKRLRLQNENGTLTNSSMSIDFQQNVSRKGTLERNIKRISTLSNASRKYIFQKENVVLIQGRPGCGKTSIILRLVDYSCFGRKNEESIDVANISCLLKLSKQIVGYHFCQKGNKYTTLVPEFVHNLAAQLCQAPILLPYRNLLLNEFRYHEILSMESCISDPKTAFIQGILEPIKLLISNGSIMPSNCILVIDALNESEDEHIKKLKPFLLNIISILPSWIKIILTSRDSIEGLSIISLDDIDSNDNIRKDIYDFINKRIETSSDIQSNILNNRTSSNGTFNNRFAKFLSTTSQGCFLYVDNILNMMEKRHLVIKSDSFRIIPTDLDQMYLLMMNIKFNTLTSFENIKPIMEICIAAIYPLTMLEIYYTLNSGLIRHFVSWRNFLDVFDALISSNILCKRNDGTVMIIHPTLIDWLKNQKEKFYINIRNGHAMIALRLMRLEHPVESEKILELSYHILNAEMFENESLNALALLLSSSDVNTAFSNPRNLSNPDFQINKLLMKAKADPDFITDYLNGSSALSCFSYYGCMDLVELLIKHGADCNIKSKLGQTALHLAAEKGYISIIRILIENGCQINHVDKNGATALVLAASKGHLEIVRHLLSYKLPDIIKSFSQNTEKALIASILGGHYDICKFFLESKTLLNYMDPESGHTPLTAACTVGHRDIVELLIKHGTPINVKNKNGVSVMACAVSEGHLDIVQYLLNYIRPNELDKQVDEKSRTPLMIAASKGKIDIMDVLVSKGGALITTKDENGFSALSWASMNGQIQAITWLLERGADINGTDSFGRTPLILSVTESNVEVVQMLLNNGACINHVDKNGFTAIDRAIEISNIAIVNILLKSGAKLGPQSWATADNNPEMIMLLLGRSWNRIKSKEEEFRKSEVFTHTSSWWKLYECPLTMNGDQTL
ncbi:protein TANC2-like [Centruroides sculpturatus]|uniref:protein TANC2-like n=1 Tax=Centruroides sculpturatus TaxID=218467 RepID=UPI000C6D4815|nr:protein TANC2-like [Centruroides sculpturatus]